MATRMLFSLHLLLVAAFVVSLLSNASAAEVAKDLSVTSSSRLIGMEILDACSGVSFLFSLRLDALLMLS